jgi:hypothetical protein
MAVPRDPRPCQPWRENASYVTPGAAHEKWGDALNAGFQLVPDVLLKHQSRLGLNPVDLVRLLDVLMHWWFAEQLPFPKTSLISRGGWAWGNVQSSDLSKD